MHDANMANPVLSIFANDLISPFDHWGMNLLPFGVTAGRLHPQNSLS